MHQHSVPPGPNYKKTATDNAGSRNHAGAEHDQAGRLRNRSSDHTGGECLEDAFVVRVREVRSEERAVEELLIVGLGSKKTGFAE